jgi:pimeloyl-ACP methyl ester carboxylesterase
MEPRIQYAKTSDGMNIAYTVAGEGYPLVRVLGWGSHVEYDLSAPVWRPMLAPLVERYQLVMYDGRGTGLSDRNIKQHTAEAWLDDLLAVVEAVGLKRFALLGISQGGGTAIEYAVRHSDRVSHLIL